MNVPASLNDMGVGNARNKKEILQNGKQVYIKYTTDNPNEEVFFVFEMDQLKKGLKKPSLSDSKAVEEVKKLKQKDLDNLINEKHHVKKGVFMVEQTGGRVPVGAPKKSVT